MEVCIVEVYTMNAIDIKKIVELYKKMSIYSISCETGISVYMVKKVLKDSGVKFKHIKHDSKFKNDVLEDWTHSDMPINDITNKYHISKSGLWRITKGVKRKQRVIQHKSIKKRKSELREDTFGGIINIYREKITGDYYYGRAPRFYKDKKIDEGVSADYAFDVVCKRNEKS